MARSGIVGSRSGVAARSGWVTRGIADAQSHPTDAISVVTDMGALCTRLATDAADAIAKSFDEKINAFLKRIRAQWPRKTSYSVGRFGIAVRQVGDTFILTLANDAVYSGWIYEKDKGKQAKLVAKVLILDAADPVATEIARDVADYLGD